MVQVRPFGSTELKLIGVAGPTEPPRMGMQLGSRKQDSIFSGSILCTLKVALAVLGYRLDPVTW
jgi:hypothetical protein